MQVWRDGQGLAHPLGGAGRECRLHPAPSAPGQRSGASTPASSFRGMTFSASTSSTPSSTCLVRRLEREVVLGPALAWGRLPGSRGHDSLASLSQKPTSTPAWWTSSLAAPATPSASPALPSPGVTDGTLLLPSSQTPKGVPHQGEEPSPEGLEDCGSPGGRPPLQGGTHACHLCCPRGCSAQVTPFRMAGT